MTESQIAVIMRVLGRLESKVDQLTKDQATLAETVKALSDAALVETGVATTRTRLLSKLGAMLVGLAVLTSSGTGLIVYYSNTTHPPDAKPGHVTPAP